MRMHIEVIGTFIALVYLLFAPVLAWPQPTYTYLSLEDPSNPETVMRGLNESAEIVGEGYTDHVGSPFLLQGSAYNPVQVTDEPGHWDVKLFGVTTARTIVGNLQDVRGFYLDRGGPTFLVHPKRGPAMAFGIYDCGKRSCGKEKTLIAGSYWALGEEVAFVLKGGKTWMKTAPKHSLWSRAYGVTAKHGILVSGTFGDENDVRHGFLYHVKTGKHIQLDVPGATETYGEGLNDKGHVVGCYVDPVMRKFRGFLWDGRDYWPIDFQDAFATGASDVNNKGQVVGTYVVEVVPEEQWVTRGFIATPTPALSAAR